jgi:hypothetical protein
LVEENVNPLLESAESVNPLVPAVLSITETDAIPVPNAPPFVRLTEVEAPVADTVPISHCVVVGGGEPFIASTAHTGTFIVSDGKLVVLATGAPHTVAVAEGDGADVPVPPLATLTGTASGELVGAEVGTKMDGDGPLFGEQVASPEQFSVG